ncbi:hypothetical protein J8281_18475 [Aquimarina sp. U1-2]|uniref:hypothetical protein n=1 Tax=Aquimarina sp. U1-2 TaxID=2823141 RepID=UPI001AECFC37|nr:hypothetical protein [Aquimarina sp. U1-2]MBP2834190.1 hypothetical protein [Aquimarina sp. U1-2]
MQQSKVDIDASTESRYIPVMKKMLCCILVWYYTFDSSGQYDPDAINYGIVAIKSFGLENEIALGARIEYASNCYTTFIGEYNRTFAINATDTYQEFNEFALGVNLIMFNWYPTTITAGIGYLVNDYDEFEAIQDEAFLGFRSGDFNHGAQIKMRALYQITTPIHIFAELNVKSLGRRFDTFLVGFSYNFSAR